MNFDFLQQGYYCMSPLGILTLVEDYVWYDGPQIALFKHADGYYLFGILLEDNVEDKEMMWMMKVVNEGKLKEITEKKITLREVFQPHCILSLMKYEDTRHIGSWCVPSCIVPECYFSEKGVYLP